MLRNGGLISIEGLDGSGKSTQINMLINYMISNDIKQKFIHFPQHNVGTYGKLISKFLRGEFGSIDAVHPQLVALLFAGDRMEASPMLKRWLEEGYTVIMDRYVLSNIAFQCAKLDFEGDRQELTDWIYDLEYKINQIPIPDVSLYLNAPIEFTIKCLADRKLDKKEYLNGGVDIHEDDIEFQMKVKNIYNGLAATNSSIRTISCYDTADHKMKSMEEIHQLILNEVL
jgi:dTMP kinase